VQPMLLRSKKEPGRTNTPVALLPLRDTQAALSSEQDGMVGVLPLPLLVKREYHVLRFTQGSSLRLAEELVQQTVYLALSHQPIKQHFASPPTPLVLFMSSDPYPFTRSIRASEADSILLSTSTSSRHTTN
jgi:hypothetical protein